MSPSRRMASPSRTAKDRGRRWELEVAKRYGGVRKWAGPGTDVETPDGRVIEAKSRQDDGGLKLLVEWVEQARSYSDDWVLCIKLGLGAQALKLEVRPFGASAPRTSEEP